MTNQRDIIRTESLTKVFFTGGGLLRKKKPLHALTEVSVSVPEGKVTAVVGESGSGKSTLARLILRLIEPTAGRIFYRSVDITSKRGGELREFRKKVQVIFQDPFASLNPRMKVFSTLSEPLKIHKTVSGSEMKGYVVSLLRSVGLSEDALHRYPHEFSGGQRQRISIARALALKPELIIADEPLSSLDVSIQAQILNLLNKLREEYNLSFLFISHDLNVVRYFSDYVYVMYLGEVVEAADADELFNNPLHPYTRRLLEAIPGKRKYRVSDTPSPSLGEINENGCRFYPRCPDRLPDCRDNRPSLKEKTAHLIACNK